MVKKKSITFSSILKKSIYADRNTIYDLVPKNGFMHRIDEKNELVMELSPVLMSSAVSGIFIYGTPGTGKTGITMELMDDLKKEAKKSKTPLTTLYLNCSENRTETVILMELISALNPNKEYPKMGWTRTKALAELTNILDKKDTNILLVLDEVDYALKESGDDILYRLSRINNKVSSNISTIIISNDIRVGDYIKPKTQSSFGRVKVIFSPYNSEEMYDILKQRSKSALKSGAVGDQVLQKIAEIESSRGGDARKALELLDSCAKIATAKSRNTITLDLVDEADASLEKDNTVKTLSGLATQQKILYLAMLKLNKPLLDSVEVYKTYKAECSKYNAEPLTERRIRTFLIEFGELGLIQSEVGWLKDLRRKSRKITLSLDSAIKNKVRKLLRDSI